MYRVIGTLRRSYACHQISKAENFGSFWSFAESVKIGAGYYSKYAPNDIVQSKVPTHSTVNEVVGFQNKELKRYYGTNNREQRKKEIEMLPKPVGKNNSAAEKRKFLINTLFDLKDSKESVYGTLDAWVAVEPIFPLASLRQALVVLEKHEQWHRIVQVVKWILSKGQGTMGIYKLLIEALEKDNRAEEAHTIWESKIGHNLHSVSWDFCDLMLSIYYRNNMLDRLVQLFRCIESYGRKPPRKSIVRKVADAYEVLGLSEEKDKLLNEYSYLFDKSSEENKRKYRYSKKTKKEDKKENSKVEC